MAFDREELLKKLAMALVANPGSTMQELADSAGISKASLHRIYSTKEKLQATIVERMREVFAEIRRTIQKPHEDYMEALRELVDELQPLAATRAQSFRVDVAPALHWDAPWEAVETLLANLLLNAVQHGGARAADADRAELHLQVIDGLRHFFFCIREYSFHNKTSVY